MQNQSQQASSLKTDVNAMPGAWYDASARIESMAAIARAIMSASDSIDHQQALANTVSLAMALEDISKLALKDIERIEKEMLS